jgi:YbgC/YbaW family acyl-CoA thioester hydrolase
MKRNLTCKMKVRSYELDAYGHVNHAVFLNYYEQARGEYLEQAGLSFGSLWDDGFVFVIVRAEVDYIKPLAMSDQIEISGEIEEIGNTSVTLRQEIYKIPERELISRGRFTAVFLDRRTQEPAPAPESFRKAFLSQNDGFS